MTLCLVCRIPIMHAWIVSTRARATGAVLRKSQQQVVTEE
jgi:hypothetical protein